MLMKTSVAELATLDAGHPCFGCAVRQIAVCGVLESAALREFKQSGPTVHYKAGETVVFESDEATSVYSLATGLLRLSKLLPDGRRQIAGFLFPGDFLGITMEEEHAFTAEAVAESQLCRFPRAHFDAFVAGHPQQDGEPVELRIAAARAAALCGRSA